MAKLNLELKVLELREMLKRFGVGAAFSLLALLLAPLLVVFVLATVAAALATVLQVWLAILIVTCFLAVLVAGLAATGGLLISRALKGARDDGA